MSRRKKGTPKPLRNQPSLLPASKPGKTAQPSLLEEQYRVRYELAPTFDVRKELIFEILDHCFDEALRWAWFQKEWVKLFNALPDKVKQNWPALRQQQEIDFAARLNQRFMEERQRATEKQQNLSETINALASALVRKSKPSPSRTGKEREPIRDLGKLQRMKSLSQEQAATELDCSARTIRSLATKNRLTRTQTGRIAVDAKFTAEFEQRHSSS